VRDRDLYARILGVEAPWRVVDVKLDENQVEVVVEHSGKGLRCPTCGAKATKHDVRRRSWRHLDTCQLKTIITADVPRVSCEEHGVHQIGECQDSCRVDSSPSHATSLVIDGFDLGGLKRTVDFGSHRRVRPVHRFGVRAFAFS